MRLGVAAAVLCTLALLLAPSASAAGYQPEEVPARWGPVRLEMPPTRKSPLTLHSFTFARNLDYCGPKGERTGVSLRELPLSPLYPHPSAVITVTVFFPAFQRPNVCPPLPYMYETLRVRTKRPAADLRFYDGSFEPPRLLFPRPHR
jgi:hypothetical protein